MEVQLGKNGQIVLQQIQIDYKAYAYWVSSPSAVHNENIMAVYYYGRVRHHYYDGKTVAFRPVVCLSSKVVLELNEKTGKYEINEF